MAPASPSPAAVLLLCLIGANSLGGGGGGVAARRRGEHRDARYDALSTARCEAHCWPTNDKSSCVKQCLRKGFEKPGVCPNSISPLDLVCISACSQDSDCPALKKCCQHKCGITCKQPEYLDRASGVPNLPRDLNVTECGKKRTVFVEWKPGSKHDYGRQSETVLYLIEERHHPGKNFIEKLLGDWGSCAPRCVLTNETFQFLKNFVKAGTWYQFRVAAINRNGTIGFIESSPFTSSKTPKPPKAPQNMTVGPFWTTNASVYAELRWSPPVSDLPIQRYKVFWSKRLQGATALDSVLVKHKTISKDQTKFLLEALQPDALYFLQVQALSQYGKERLRGEKSGLVLNTTNYTNVTEHSASISTNSKSRIEGLHLQELFWSQGELRARIAWRARKHTMRYTVTWWTGTCHSNNIHRGYNHLKLAATTKASHFDIYDLQFSCRYRVSVREVSGQGMKSMHDTSVTFTTPKCEDFRLRFKKVRCIN